MQPLRLALAALLLSGLARCEEGTCETESGGTCKTGVCFTWRNALCTKGQKCTCQAGSCASEKGECVPEGSCARLTTWNCDFRACPHQTKSVCSPKPAFPAPCAQKFAEFLLGLMGLGLVMCCGICVCVFKHAFHGPAAGLSGVAILGMCFLAYTMYTSISESCFAVGIMHQSGYDVPTVPPNWDAPLPTALGGLSSMQPEKCVCPQESCSVSNGLECVPNGDCPKMTGGSCTVLGCAASRKATCETLRHGYSYCMCGEDSCAKDGACVPKAEYFTALYSTGLGNVSARLGGPMAGADSMAVKEVGGVWAPMCAVAVAGMATAAVSVVMASKRGQGPGSEPLLAED